MCFNYIKTGISEISGIYRLLQNSFMCYNNVKGKNTWKK